MLFLAEVVTRYTARYPAVSVDLHLTGRVVDLVAEGFDVAFRVAAKLEDSSLIVRRVAPVLFHLYASPVYLARRGTPRTEGELEAHERVVFRGPQKLRVPGPREAPAREPRGSSATTSCSSGTRCGPAQGSGSSRPSSRSRTSWRGGSCGWSRASSGWRGASTS